ncbi:MAG: type II toxin-antitoxin system HicA family toxin [Calditrichia bacterium]
MTKKQKLVAKILAGKSDSNIDFDSLINLLKAMDFKERISGSHHIFYKDDVDEIINLQALTNGKAKSYQIKQVRNIILKYKLGE